MFLVLYFFNAQEAKTHCENSKEPALNADERNKWMTNVDLLAASKLFQVNIIVVNEKIDGSYKFQLYTPKITNSVT